MTIGYPLNKKMKSLINIILRLFVNPDSKEHVEIRRNEPCFCNSGRKFKNCHLSSVEKKGQIALYEFDKKTKKKEVKIYPKRKYKGISSKPITGLRGVDVKATNVALDEYNPEVHKTYKFQ